MRTNGVTLFGWGDTSDQASATYVQTGPCEGHSNQRSSFPSAVQKTRDSSYRLDAGCPSGPDFADDVAKLTGILCFGQFPSGNLSRVQGGDSGGPWVAWYHGYWVELAANHGANSPRKTGNESDGSSVAPSSIRSQLLNAANSQGTEIMSASPGTVIRDTASGHAWIVEADGFRYSIPTGGDYLCFIATHPLINTPRFTIFDIDTIPEMVGSTRTCNPNPPPVPGYRIMNADGGVYWRATTDWNSAIRITGFGVYTGDRVQLICWARGGTVPPLNNNPLWYQATVISGQGRGTGFVNDHFIDTGINVPNIVVPGVPPCSSSTPPPPPPPPGTTYAEQEWNRLGVNTFSNFHNATGFGQHIPFGQVVQVSCKVYDPTIPSVNPDGYWYRIASSPWSNGYYAPANTFLNGDPPGGPYTHNTDFSVPDCGAPPPPPPPPNPAPVITGVSNATGHVGDPGPVLQIAYTDPQCDVTSGIWEGATGSGLGQNFSVSGGCSGGVGTATFARTCQWYGRWTEYVTLTDAAGNHSQRFAFTFSCLAKTSTAPAILAVTNSTGVVGSGGPTLSISYNDPECDVVSGLWEGPTGSGQTQTFPTPQPTTCTGGNGTATFSEPCQQIGQSTDYITLTDSIGNQSQRYAYTFTCYPADQTVCSGIFVADVTYSVTNSAGYNYDPYPTPRFWANVNSYTVHRRWWKTGSSNFCELTTIDPLAFTTVSGKSPNGTGTVPTGLTGHGTSTERILWSADGFSPQAPVGYLGAFDLNCAISDDRTSVTCPGTHPPGVASYLTGQAVALVDQETDTEQADNGTSMTCTLDTTRTPVSSCNGDITGPSSNSSWALQQTLLPVPSATFGDSAALSADGSTAIIGGSTDGGGSGAVWVFARTGQTWSQQAKITAPADATGAGPAFGFGVALSPDGNTAFIGGPDSGQGTVWVYTRSGSTWTEAQRIFPADASNTTEFGFRVAISSDGTTALISALNNDGVNCAAWVYVLSGSTWIEQQMIPNPTDRVGQSLFGISIGLAGDGNTAIIGGTGDNGQGAAWVFTRSGANWSEQQKIPLPADATQPGLFGSQVGLSSDGNTALIEGTQTWAFTRNGSTWTELLTGPQAGPFAMFSDASAAFVDGSDNGNSVVWLVTHLGSTWTQQSKLDAPGGATDFPGLLALSQDAKTLLVVGKTEAWIFTAP